MIKISPDEGRDDCPKLKPKGTRASLGTTVIAVTILILSIFFSRVNVNVLVFVLRVLFFIVYTVTRYMYDARRRDFALSGSFVLSELTIQLV